MGRVISELVGGEIVVTRYESNGFIIPDKLSQEKIQLVSNVMNSNLDKYESDCNLSDDKIAISRGDFIFRLLSMSDECVEKYSTYGKGLYSSNDMLRGITLAEVAYLVYYVGGIKRTLNWGNIKPSRKFKVCVLQELVEGKKLINEKLAMYKNRQDMEYYIKSIRNGERFIPLPLYCAFVDFMNNKDVGLELTEDLFFKRLSESEFNIIFGG